MAVREFDGTDDEIRWAIDALSGMTFGTFGLIFKTVTAASGVKQAMALHTSGGTWRCFMGYNGSTNHASVHNNTAFSNSPDSSVDDDTWHTVIYRKATGSNTGRYSIYDHTAAAWTHANGSAAIGDWSSPGSSGTMRTSFQSSSEFFQGRIAVAAIWSNEVHWTADSSGDTAIEAAGLEDSLLNWEDEAPDALWAFCQTSVTDVFDLVGTSDQTAVTGTTVVTGDDPPGFTFDLTGFLDLESADSLLLESADEHLLEAGAAGGAGDATVILTTIARSFTVSQVTVSVDAVPATIARSFTVPQVMVGVGATAATIARSVTMPQATVSVDAVPTTIARAFTLPQTVVSVGVALTTIPLAFGIPQIVATGEGGGDASVTLTTIARSFTVPQVTVDVGVALATIPLAFTIPQISAVGEGGVTVTPETIALAFGLPLLSVDTGAVDKPWKLLGGGPPIRGGYNKYATRRPGWN